MYIFFYFDFFFSFFKLICTYKTNTLVIFVLEKILILLNIF